MLKNYISAALANLRRNWLYATITIGGLAVSFAAAILIGLYLRDEYSFESFLPQSEQVYRLANTLNLPGQKPIRSDAVPALAAANFRLEFPQVAQIARLMTSNNPTLKRGDATF